jgi:AcrR family transcriptional regulator
MSMMLPNIHIQINEKIYLKNPDTSDLGRKIITGSIDLIDNLGFEQFTFRKLAKNIESTEASIYRYFENKHKLLLYLTCWYWNWMDYRLIFGLANIESPEERLKRGLGILTKEISEDSNFSHINEVKLNHIVIAESSKVYLTKSVDKENELGVFAAYKKLVARLSDIILEINAQYKYSHMLISTVIEGVHHQRYFSEHLPSLTDCIEGEDAITAFYSDMVFKAIK